MVKSNKELAEGYINKQRLLGKDILKFDILNDDKVRLVKVKDIESDGRLVIPSFVTSIEQGCLIGSKYSEIYIYNKDEVEISIKGLCFGMDSTKLKVSCKSPDYIVDISYLFSNCHKLEELDISGLCVSKVRDLSYTFKDCNNLRSIDISNWGTSNVTDMKGLFQWCTKLGCIVGISGLDTSKVEDMSSMFEGCASLEHIDIRGWVTNKVEDMSNMFNRCEAIRGIKLGYKNMSKVMYMDKMYRYCSKLEYIDMSGVIVNELNRASKMFSNCKNLKDIRFNKNLDISSLIQVDGMFEDCDSLKAIYIDRINIRGDINIRGICNGCGNLREIVIREIHIDGRVSLCRNGKEFDWCHSLDKLLIGDNVYIKEDIIQKYKEKWLKLL